MKRQLLYISVAMLCHFGCSASLDVATGHDAEAGDRIKYHYVNRYLAGRIATINLNGGERIEAQVIAMAPDSTWLFEPQDSLQKAIQTSDILSVEVTDRALGTTGGRSLERRLVPWCSTSSTPFRKTTTPCGLRGWMGSPGMVLRGEQLSGG